MEPVKFYRTGGMSGLVIEEPNNLIINPLTLTIQHQDSAGRTIMMTQNFVGPNKLNFEGWTPSTANQWFEAGKTYRIKAAQISSYISPVDQTVTFMQDPTVAAHTKVISFVYSKPELVLHYTFDDENNLARDSSQKGNHGQIF